ncbi:MAG: NAD-dependent epimerase/dehydratase family protein, partial [Nitrosopumilaceae archaeon]
KHTVLPKTAYGVTKMTSEHYLRLYNEMYGIDYVIFRFFNIYGKYQKNGLIPSIYQKISTNQPILVFGKGDQIRDFVYIEDIISFFDKAVRTKVADNLILNMGTGIGTSIEQIINIFSKIMKVFPKIDYNPERAGEVGNFVADTELLISTFGTAPKTSVEEGLKKTILWLNGAR